MKYFLLLLLSISAHASGFAQGSNHEVDRKMNAISESETSSTDAIARYIKNNFATDADKVRAAYTWVINNIKYDTDSMYAINWNLGGSLKITESLRRRKGVCENFSGIFVDIISKAGLPGITIDGYTKQANLINTTGHTWAAVNLDGRWYLFDPTWDKDRSHDYNHFMISPGGFVNSHMPFDPLWQLTDNPISHRAFQARGSGSSEPMVNYADSVRAHMRMGELEKLLATARRMKKADQISELIKNRLSFLQMQIATIYEERDMQLYNAAVNDLNNATDRYNKFVSKMNLQEALHDLQNEYIVILDPALTSLNRALSRIGDIGKYMPNYQYDPTALKMRVLEMAEKIRLVKPQTKTISKNR